MEFQIKNIKKSTNDLMRTIGYQPAYFQPGPASVNDSDVAREISIVRQIGRNDYPRFHLYIKEVSSQVLEVRSYLFSIHLDQKKPSYEGAKGHNGDYDGPVVEGEIERIERLLG